MRKPIASTLRKLADWLDPIPPPPPPEVNGGGPGETPIPP
jgi:hypothetical protein